MMNYAFLSKYQIDYQKTEYQNFVALAEEEIKTKYNLQNDPSFQISEVGTPMSYRVKWVSKSSTEPAYNTVVKVTYYTDSGGYQAVNLVYWRLDIGKIRTYYRDESSEGGLNNYFENGRGDLELRLGLPKESKYEITNQSGIVLVTPWQSRFSFKVRAKEDSLLFKGVTPTFYNFG